MIAAGLYVLTCTWKNRLRRRIQRLREPRYLIGAIAGVAYLYFAVFRRLGYRGVAASRAGRGAAPLSLAAALGPGAPLYGGVVLLLIAVGSWLFPMNSGLLDFTPAETQFLLTAPMSRSSLIVYRLLRSNFTVLFGAAIMSLLYPASSSMARVQNGLAIWLLLMTAHVFFTAVTLSRPRLRETGLARRMAWAPLAAIAAVTLIVVRGVVRELGYSPAANFSEAAATIEAVVSSGPAHRVLWPFIALARPFFVVSWTEFGPAIAASGLVFASTIVWLIAADYVFQRYGSQLDDVRGEARPTQKKASYRARPIGWRLALTGRPETAFAWKAALQTFRIVDARVMVRLVLIVAWLVAVVALAPGARGFAQMAGVFAAFGCGFATLMAPQIVRVDLRQDLQHLDVLKTWPVRASAVIRGEMAWPAATITLVAWAFGAIALFFSAAVFERTGLAMRTSIGLAVMILVPALVFAQYTIHNATALLFPAWVPVGSGRPRGVDAMGQRLILLGGTWLMLIVSLAPGVIIGAILWVAFQRFIGPWILLPAALIALVIIALEVLFATEALGPAYERLDITSVERPD